MVPVWLEGLVGALSFLGLGGFAPWVMANCSPSSSERVDLLPVRAKSIALALLTDGVGGIEGLKGLNGLKDKGVAQSKPHHDRLNPSPIPFRQMDVSKREDMDRCISSK